MLRIHHRLTIILLLVCIAMAFGKAPRATVYGEDIRTPHLASHSTFHYELTRALAKIAGFNAEEAERLAVIDEATDTGSFTGETNFSVTLQGTQRVSTDGLYWHFARRDRDNVTNEYVLPGGRNTCEYFTGAFNTCPSGKAELEDIEAWAIYGRGTPSTGIPQISLDGGEVFRNVSGQSLEALAIYLHALADSYSHEACMKAEQFRGHKPRPLECTAVDWHIDEEYGRTETQDEGVRYTEEAGMATWQALKWYRAQNGLFENAKWNETQVQAFVQKWAGFEQAEMRRDFAVKVFEAL